MARKTIYLHVGLHKTGTTYIQTALKQNSAELARMGVLYYQDPEYADQWFSRHTLALSIRHIRHNTIHMSEPPEQVWSRFLREVALFDGECILVSSEVFVEGVDKEFIQKKLAEHTIRLVFYVREQSQVIGSQYTEKVKQGYAEDADSYYEQFKDEMLDYYAEVERWSAIFGEESIIVRDFNRVTRQGNLLQDLLALTGLGREQFSQLSMPQRNSNLRYPAQLVELLLAFNKLPIAQDEMLKFRYYLDYLVKSKPEISGLPRFDVDEDLQQRVKAYCRQSNSRLSEKYALEGENFFV